MVVENKSFGWINPFSAAPNLYVLAPVILPLQDPDSPYEEQEMEDVGLWQA